MNLKKNIQQLLDEIIALKTSHLRDSDILLLAVSKTFPATDIKKAYEAGLNHFGENYLQEALDKQKELKDLPLIWHFIGQIQSNKAALISENFDWVQTLSRTKIAKILNESRPKTKGKLNVLVQVNLNDETTKGGLALDEVASFCKTLQNYENLAFRGLMAIPEKTPNIKQQAYNFKRLKGVFNILQKSYPIDTLSIGMSNDYPIAIQEGSTLVRIGSKIFGQRTTIPLTNGNGV